MADEEKLKHDINILVISNILSITCDYDIKKSYRNGVPDNLHFNALRYEEYFESTIDFSNIDIIIIWMNFESLFPDALCSFLSDKNQFFQTTDVIFNRLSNLYTDVKKKSKGLVFFIGLEDYYNYITKTIGEVPLFGATVDRINISIMDLMNKEDFFVDLKRIIADIGCEKSFNNTWKYRWNAPYSQTLYSQVWTTVYGRFCSLYRKKIKCVILDCDNVLWGGTLAEDGIENIIIGIDVGREYQEFQRFILALYYLGVSVCVCSKNSEEDIRRVFREHSAMILKEDNIDIFQVSWESKVKGIKNIEKLLNISLDSIIFIDDSEHEINEVRACLPEVNSILYETKKIYKDLSFFLSCLVDEQSVKNRHMFYKNSVLRNTVEEMCESPEEYAKKIKNKVQYSIAKKIESERIVELLNRVNKMTNGCRFTRVKIDDIFEDSSYKHFSVHVSDMFSNLGLVGYICICNNILVSFALSCRAMGRGIELEMIEFAKKEGAKFFLFTATGKNKELSEKLNKSGLELVESNIIKGVSIT